MSKVEDLLALIFGTAVMSAIALGVFYLRGSEINAPLVALVVVIALGLVFWGLRKTRA